jgi:hypothetical protein
LGELARDAKDLLTAVRAVQGQWAVKAATDLVHDLSILKGRRSNYLPQGSIEEIENIIRVLNLVRSALGMVELHDVWRIRTIKNCQKIHQKACEIAGSIERTAEEL